MKINIMILTKINKMIEEHTEEQLNLLLKGKESIVSVISRPGIIIELIKKRDPYMVKKHDMKSNGWRWIDIILSDGTKLCVAGDGCYSNECYIYVK
jgi:hypothetical protein